MQTMKMMYYPFVHPPRPVLWQAHANASAAVSLA
jgi:hypothetical protein